MSRFNVGEIVGDRVVRGRRGTVTSTSYVWGEPFYLVGWKDGLLTVERERDLLAVPVGEQVPVLGDLAGIYAEVAAERAKKVRSHGVGSLEAAPPLDLWLTTILSLEVGEVARLMNVANLHTNGPRPSLSALRTALIHVAATAVAWADKIPATETAS